jgi:hypothetical protein
VVVVVDLAEEGQLLVAQPLLHAHEAPVARPLAEALEALDEQRLVLGSHRADDHPASVAEADLAHAVYVPCAR